jgi:hypothetical protein
MYKYGNLPGKVDLQMIREKMAHVDYIYRGTLTICIVEMQNGFKVIGESACVDPQLYSKAKGEQYSFADAIDKLFMLEGYLLLEKRKEYVESITKSHYYFDTDRNKPLEPVQDYNL